MPKGAPCEGICAETGGKSVKRGVIKGVETVIRTGVLEKRAEI